MNQIEVEMRTMFDEREYTRLKDFLRTHATDLGVDDKNVWFFLMPDKLLKVVHNVSQNTAKISLKLSSIGQGSAFGEQEVPIDPKDCQKMVDLLLNLGYTEMQNTPQKRHNYVYEGVEIALKQSETWGYHAELEILVGDESEVAAAEKKIREVAQKLHLSLLTEEELQILTENINKKFREGGFKQTIR
jgi:predicted adenylyl cyclase CyaB